MLSEREYSIREHVGTKILMNDTYKRAVDFRC